MNTFFIVLLVIASVIIIVATLLMDPKTGSGTAFGQDSNTFGTSVHKSKDQFLNKVTIVAGVVFVASLIAILAL